MANPPGLIDSRNQIADLIHRYAYNVRHQTMDGTEDLFCLEVEFVIREQNKTAKSEPTVRSHLVGREETLDYIRRSSAATALCPLIHNLLIEVDGAKARSTCVMENRTWPAIPGLIGEYEDSFEFDGRWRFARRIYTMFLE